MLEIEGKDLTGINFELVRSGSISGRVVNRDGEPVPNVMIQAGQPQYPAGVRRLMSRTGNIFTNDLGEYRIPSLIPGTYYISALLIRGVNRRNPATGLPQPAAQDRSATPPLAYQPTYYPNILDEASAVSTAVASGADVQGIDIVMRQAPVTSVRGRLQNLTGKTDAPVNISLQRLGVFEGTTPDSYTAPDAEGNFELSAVVPGSYNLIAELRIDNQRTLRTSVPIVAGDKPLEGVQVALSGGVQIQGTLTTESGQGAGNRRITLGWSGIIYAGNLPATGTTKDDGTFEMQSVNPGSYYVQMAPLQPGEYIKSARMGGVDVLENGVVLTGAPPGPLQVVIGTKSGTITGSVKNAEDNPVPLVTVALVPTSPSRQGKGQWYRTMQTDKDGNFTLSNLPPGEFRLFSWNEVPTQAWMNAAFMQPLESKGVRVTVKESSSETVTLKVIP
jgi:hypothetical protein